jgi:hypothetical protein
VILPQKPGRNRVQPVQLLAGGRRGVEQDGQGVGADPGPVDASAAECRDGLGEQRPCLLGASPLVSAVIIAFAGERQQGHAQGVTRALEVMVGDRPQLVRRVGGAIRIARRQDGEISSGSHVQITKGGTLSLHDVQG